MATTPPTTVHPHLYRGTVTNSSIGDTLDRYDGVVRFDGVEFTPCEMLADGFALMDDDIDPGQVRVKFFTDNTRGTVTDDDLVFVTGEFFAESDVLDDGVTVVVTMQPTGHA